MQRVVSNPTEARSKGSNARTLMVEKFTPRRVGALIVDRLQEIRRRLEADGAL